MSLIGRWFQGKASGEARSGGMSPDAFAMLGAGGAASSAGVFVSEESSLRLTPVLASIRILSNSVAMLPLPVYRRIKGGKVREYSHPLYRLLQEQSNPEMTAFEMRRWLMQGAVGWGNGYGLLEWSRGGRLLAIWPMLPGSTKPVRKHGALVYEYTYGDGKTVILPEYEVLHIRGMTLNGIEGISPIRQMMREAVGLGLAAQEFGAGFYRNGAVPGAILEHPGVLGEKARNNLLSSWNAGHMGLVNAHKLKILEEGMKYHAVTIPPDEAQFLETRKFQVSEIARAFGVPPHLIGDLDKATFSNIEHQAIEFAQYSLHPWMTQIEQAINAKCLPGSDEQYLFVEHVSEALVKTDIRTRYEAHQIAILTGFETPNEARAAENRNPLPGGDVLLQPLNMAPMGSKSSDAEAQRHRGELRELQLQEGQQLFDAEAQGRGDAVNGDLTPDPSPEERGEGQKGDLTPDPSPEERGAGADAGGGGWYLAPVVRDCAERLARREFADRARGRTGFEKDLIEAARRVFAPVAEVAGVETVGDFPPVPWQMTIFIPFEREVESEEERVRLLEDWAFDTFGEVRDGTAHTGD